MKRFLTVCLVAVILLAGVASTFRVQRGTVAPDTTSSSHQKTTSDQHPSFFDASDLLLSTGMTNEQIRLTHSIPNVSYRIYPSLLNGYRIQHSEQMVQQKFFSGNVLFLLNCANKQLKGYYLYYLRKLLI